MILQTVVPPLEYESSPMITIEERESAGEYLSAIKCFSLEVILVTSASNFLTRTSCVVMLSPEIMKTSFQKPVEQRNVYEH